MDQATGVASILWVHKLPINFISSQEQITCSVTWSDWPFRQSYGYSVRNSFERSMIKGRKTTEEASEVEIVRSKIRQWRAGEEVESKYLSGQFEFRKEGEGAV